LKIKTPLSPVRGGDWACDRIKLAGEGARVDVSRSEEIERTADELNKTRAGSAKYYAVDVADHAAVQKTAEKFWKTSPRSTSS